MSLEDVVLLAKMAPEEVGRLGGVGFVFFLLFAGVAKCVQISQRPTTSALCVSSLACFLAAWMISTIRTAMNPVGATNALILVVFALLILASLILGIVGLIDYRRQPGRYDQGKGQAIWGILLSGLMIGLISKAVFDRFAAEDAIARQIAADDTSMEFEADGIKSQTFEDLNFRFDSIEKPWVIAPAAGINPVASLACMRKNPEVWFIIIAEKIGVETEFDNNALAEVAKTNLRASATNLRVNNQYAEKVNGLDGVRIEIDAVSTGRSISYSMWVCAHHGFAYQLVAFSSVRDKSSLATHAREACRGFHLIDDQRITHTAGIDATEKHNSPEWGYSIDFSKDPGWAYVPRADMEIQAADFNSSRVIDGELVSVGVIPIGPPDENVDSTQLLSRMADVLFQVSSAAAIRQKAVRLNHANYKGSEIADTRNSGQSQFGYRLRLLLANDRAYLLAGWWPLTCKQADDRVRKIFEEVELFQPKGDSKSYVEGQFKAVGLLLNDLGISYYADGDLKKAGKYFKSAVDTYADATITSNLVDLHLDRNEFKEAQTLLDEQLQEFPDDYSLRRLKAELHQRQEQPDEAMEVYAELFTDGYSNEGDLLIYLNLAVEAETYDESIRVLQEFISRHSSLRAKRWLAVMHARMGEHDVAIQQMLAICELHDDDDTLYTLAEVYEIAEQHSQVLKLCEEMLAKNPSDVSLHLIKGRGEFELRRYPASQQSFEKVLEQYPNNEEAKQYMQYLAALLGKGDRTQISQPVEPVPLPVEVMQLMQVANGQASTEDEDQFDSVDIYKVSGFSYQRDSHLRTTNYRKFKVNTMSGVDANSTLTMSFDPLFERVYVNLLTVTDHAGQVVAEGDVDDYYVLDDSESTQASQDRRIHIPVPNLKPGYTIELVVTTEDISEPEEFGFEEQYLVSLSPMRLGAVFYQGDLNAIDSSASRMDEQTVGSDLKIWSVQSPQVFELESHQATFENFLPYVKITDADSTWEEVGREYLERIEPKLQLDDKTKSVALQLVNDGMSRQQKIATLAKHVQAECTYKAIEFGVRAQVPNTAEQVRRNGYGDCKDHSVLLMQLLKSAGVEARLALVNTEGPVIESLPSISQFDHMIVFVPNDESSGAPIFLDATEKYTTPMVPKAPGLENKLALVLEKSKPYLARTPNYGKSAALIRVEQDVELGEPKADGAMSLVVSEKVTFNPYCSRGLRGYLQNFGARERRRALRDLLAEVEKIRIKSLKVENLNDPTQTLELRMEYEIARSFRSFDMVQQARKLIGSMPALWTKYALDVAFDEERSTPFEFTMPLEVRSKTTVSLPAEVVLLNPDQLAGKKTSKFINWATRVNVNEADFAFEAVFRRRTGKFSPSEFETYHERVQEAISAASHVVKLGGADSI